MLITTSKIELIAFHFLAIYLFEDFLIENTTVTLVLKSSYTSDNVRSAVQLYLSLLNNLTELEFYIIEREDDKFCLELRCNSDEELISKLETEILLKYLHLI